MKPFAPAPARSGIALIVTLGFLAVIAILAVAFAITMRVERLAARSFADGVRARQLAHVGLARALADIHAHADANSLLYPQWTSDSFPSAGTTGPANFLTGSATNYLPGSVLTGARSRASAVRWVDVTSGTNLIGRYAYLAVNCSGLIDPNVDYSASGTATARKYGQSPYELAYNSAFLGEFAAGAGVNLTTGRIGSPRSKAWRRAESVPDLWVAGWWGYGTRPFIGNPPVSNLFPFSYFPAGFRDQGGSIEEPINIAVAATSLNAGQIASRLQGMGLTAANATAVAGNLVDYLDSDWTPHNLDTFSSEPVPMINEVVIENLVAYDDSTTTWSNQVRMRVEVFYPFGYPTPASGFQLQFTVQPVGGDFVIGPQTETQNIPNLSLGGTEFWVNPQRIFSWTYVSTNAPAMPTSLQITDLSVRRSGVVVDRVRAPINIPWVTHFHASPVGATIPTGSSWAVDDPRINWDWDAQWMPPVETKIQGPTGSLGAMNPKASATLAQAGRDGHRAMYARNGNGNIEVPGELGFLLYDANRPWQTIPLYGPDALPVLDHFTTNTNAFRTGLVNLNSENRNVLAQVFFDTPLERWPGETGAPRVTVAQATALATAIYNAGGAPNQYTNVSHIARAGAGIDAALSGLDPLQRKAVVRNSSMLLGTRQNLYTIIVTAQSVVDANNDGAVQNDEIVGEQRAVAVVWRDPYRVNGNYNTFLRFFRWLDD